MECPYIGKTCRRLEKLTNVTINRLDPCDIEDLELLKELGHTGLSADARILMKELCSTKNYVNCDQFKRYEINK